MVDEELSDNGGAEGDEVTLDAGMPVVNVEGEDLGALALVLVDEESDEAAFLLVSENGEGTPSRLVPVEVVENVTEERIVLQVAPEEFDRLPRINADRDPTPAEMELAYRVLGLEFEDEDED